MVISFLTLACSSPGPMGRRPSRAENLVRAGFCGGGSPVVAAALLGPLLVAAVVRGVLLQWLLVAGGGVAAAGGGVAAAGGGVATAAARSLSRPRMYFLAASIAVPGCGVFPRSHLTYLQHRQPWH